MKIIFLVLAVCFVNIGNLATAATININEYVSRKGESANIPVDLPNWFETKTYSFTFDPVGLTGGYTIFPGYALRVDKNGNIIPSLDFYLRRVVNIRYLEDRGGVVNSTKEIIGTGAPRATRLPFFAEGGPVSFDVIVWNHNPSRLGGPGVIRVSYVEGIPPVPLPAAGWMLLAGLGAMVALRRTA